MLSDNEARSSIHIVSEAVKMASSGMQYATIAEHLNAKGYRTPRLGKPLDGDAINRMVLKAGHRKKGKYKREKSRVVAPPKERQIQARKNGTTSFDKITAVRSILKVSEMDAHERIAFALLMLGG